MTPARPAAVFGCLALALSACVTSALGRLPVPRTETDAAASQTYRPLGATEMWHSDRFMIDEEGIYYGTALLARSALAALQ